MRFSALVLFLVMVPSSPVSPDTVAESLGSKDYIKEKLKTSSRKMFAVFSHVRASGESELISIKPSQKERHIETSFNINVSGSSRKLSLNDNVIYSTSDDYSFVLVRKRPHDSYVVKVVNDSTYTNNIISAHLGNLLKSSFLINGVPLIEIVDDPTFKILKVSENSSKKEKYMKIDYDYSSKKHNMGPGWLLVSPNEGWLIHAYECQFEDRKPQFWMRCNVEYYSPCDGISLPRRVSFVRHTGTHTEHNVDFRRIALEPTPEREFTFGYYGLPDLGTADNDRSSKHVAFLFFTISFSTLAVALGMKYIAKQLEARRNS